MSVKKYTDREMDGVLDELSRLKLEYQRVVNLVYDLQTELLQLDDSFQGLEKNVPDLGKASAPANQVFQALEAGIRCRESKDSGWINPFLKESVEAVAWDAGYRNDLDLWRSIFEEK